MGQTTILAGIKGRTPGYRYDTTGLDHFQLIYVLTGELFMTVQNHVMPAHPDDVVIMPFGSAFRLHCEGQSYQGVFVNYTGELPPAYQGWEGRVLPGSPAMRAVAGLLNEEIRRSGQGAEAILHHLGMTLVLLGMRLVQGEPAETVTRTADTWVELARQRIERTIYSGQSLREILAGVPLSYRQLARHFQAVLGMTPKQYQQQCRLREAERLLRTTRQSITSIALELGFNSSQHFSALFRRERGECPSSYR
ncbi:MAG: helix-turn-helix domain-containing protein [Armatimonadota bacterium]